MKIIAIAKNCLLTAALAVGASTASYAHTFIYEATLSGANESPPQTTPGTGFARITLDEDVLTMRVEATFSGLRGTVTLAHIHCCTAVPGVSTIGVATVTPTFTGFPAGNTFGTYDRTYDLQLASSFNPAFITNNGGHGNALNTFLAGIEAGKAYFNIHTTFAGGGEIRGFLALAPVPEPETYALLLAGLGLMAVAAARRKRI